MLDTTDCCALCIHVRILDFLSDFEVLVYDTFLRGKNKVNIYIVKKNPDRFGGIPLCWVVQGCGRGPIGEIDVKYTSSDV